MHIAGGFGVGPGDAGGERLDQRYCNIAGFRRSFSECGQIKGLGVAGSLDRPRRGCRDDAGGGFGARERSLKIEHVLETGHVVADGAHGGARQHRREQGRESSTHGVRDLTILSHLCQPRSAGASLLVHVCRRVATGSWGPAALRICIAPYPAIPFHLGLPCFT
jgi:hypothetical protein